MSRVKISIIVPTYNQKPEFLRAAVLSALHQTFTDLEVVVSDNWSTNGCADVLHQITDPRLRLIRPPNHMALTDHFAFAMSEGKGEFLSILSSDDWVEPFWLAELIPTFELHQNAVLGFGEIADVSHTNIDIVNFYYRSNQLLSGYYSAKEILPLIFQFDRQSAWTVGDVIRADAYRQAGGFAYGSLTYSSDYALILRLLEIGGITYVNKPLGKYRSWGHAEGKTDSLRLSRGMDDLVKSYEILETSKMLKTALPDDTTLLKTAKARKARSMLLGFMEAVALKSLTSQEIGKVKDQLRQLDPSLTMVLLLSLVNNATLPFLTISYPIARRVYRSKFGRRLRGRST